MKSLSLSKRPKAFKCVQDGDKIVGLLYNTTILIKIGNKIVLNSDGFRTMHTKKCINLIAKDLNLDFYVKQTKGDWFVMLNNKVLAFKDDMEFSL